MPRSFVAAALSEAELPEGPHPNFEDGTALQIDYRFRRRKTVGDDDYTALPISGPTAGLPIVKLCAQLLIRAIEPWRGEVIAFGARGLSICFKGEHHVERACHSALDAQRCLVAMQADDNPLALDLAITLATGDLWLPIMGDAQQKIIGFGGPAARTAVSMQNQAAPTEILIDASVQAALGDMLTLRAGAQGGQALVEVQSEFAKPGPDDSPIAELEAV
jgi:hypothetical protein